MPITIRRALPQDAQAITGLIAAAFHEEANPAHIQSLIEGGEHLTFVAEDEQIVGFIDGFYTLGLLFRRLELDLLAVHPEHSGKGIGKALIHAFSEASANGTQRIRALVAISNTPMHHAMRATGYQLREKAMSLYISSEGKAVDNYLPSWFLIPVKTFTYTGVWLEGKASTKTIQAAHFIRESLSLNVVGTVISSDSRREIKILQASGFEFVKEYQWRQKELFPMPKR